MVSIGWSDFARNQHRPEMGNSYTTLDEGVLLELVKGNWSFRKPGMGEGDNINRKVLVPVTAMVYGVNVFFAPPYAIPKMGLPVKARLVQRQDGEAPYVQTYVTPEDAKAHDALVNPPATKVNIVCYSAEALLENGGTRTTTCDYEIVCLLASTDEADEPMQPLTMARNYLQMEGGTFTEYSANDFAESIWYWSIRKGITVRKELLQ